MNTIQEIKAIDVHGHFGRFLNGQHPLTVEFCSGELQDIVDRARQARTEFTIVSSLTALMPRFHGDAVAGNEESEKLIPSYPELRYWAVLDPSGARNFGQVELLLKSPYCMGIKVHPEEHAYPIREFGREIYEFAEQHHALILTHSGEANSLPEDFVPFADDFPGVHLILAHLGCGYDNDPSHQVRAIQRARHDNLYVDTSSAQSITPGLIEWGVREIGAERILYGTDTPLYCATMQRARIDFAEIDDESKRLILRDNARQLLRLN